MNNEKKIKDITKKIDKEISGVKNPIIKAALSSRKDDFIFSFLFGNRGEHLEYHKQPNGHEEKRWSYTEDGKFYWGRKNSNYSDYSDANYSDHYDAQGTTITRDSYQDAGYGKPSGYNDW